MAKIMPEDRLISVLNTAIKLKKVMQQRNIRSAKTPCPHCGRGMLHGRLVGPKSHLRMCCDDATCGVQMME